MSFRAKGGICFSVVALGGAVHLNEHDCLVLIHQDSDFPDASATARESTTFSRSRPLRTISSTLSRWETRTTSCSMMGPSSKAAAA